MVRTSTHTRHLSRRIHLVINSKECNLHKTVWCEEGLKLADIGTKNVREEEFNPGLGYSIVILDNWQNTFIRGVI